MSRIAPDNGYDDNTPLRELKQYVKENAAEGLYCPACRNYVKIKKYRLKRHHLAVLFKMYHKRQRNWCAMHDEFARPLKLTAYTLPEHFKLIETHSSDDPAQPDSGQWRITPAGEQFLKGQIQIRDHVFVLNDTVIEESDNFVTLRDVWERTGKFDVREVLDSTEFNLIESKIDSVLRIQPATRPPLAIPQSGIPENFELLQ